MVGMEYCDLCWIVIWRDKVEGGEISSEGGREDLRLRFVRVDEDRG